ncbi:integrase, catalytic region, zinc finger, CCHC-type containing protein [Tanacetum coccineum]
MQKEEDLKGDYLKHYEVEIKAMNLILISIPNDIYNSLDACTTAKAMWQRVERLMRGNMLNKVDRETRFNNEFDQFVAAPGEALVSVYNRFAQLMNDLEQNGINFPPVTVNTKFLNCLQPKSLKYVTSVRLAKRLTEYIYDDLFDYLHQFEKLVIASRAKKLEKSHDPLALVAHTGSSSRIPSPYYVTHPSSVADYDDDYQGDAFQNNYEDPLTSAMMLLAQAITQHFSNLTNNRLRTSSNTKNQAIVQGDIINIHSRNSDNDVRNTRRSYVQEKISEANSVQNNVGNTQRTLQTTSSGSAANVQFYNYSEKGHYARNCLKPKVRDSKYFMEQMLLAKQDEAGVNLTDEQNDFLVADVSRIEEIEELSANICLMARIQPTNMESDEGPSYDSAFLGEVHQPSTSYVNQLFSKDNEEQKYPKQPKIINYTIGDDQIDSNIIFDEPNVEVNSGSVEHDNNVLELNKLEKLSRNAYKEDTEDILDDATKSQITMTNKMKDPIAIEKKQNVCTIDYKKLNALYEDFVPQKELSFGQKYFSSSFISSENQSNASSSSSPSETKPTVAPMPNTSPNKKKVVETNKNVIAPGMYRVKNTMKQETNTNKAKSALSSTGLKDASSVKRPSSRDSPLKNSVFHNTNKSLEKIEVYVKTDVASKNVVSNKKIVTNADVQNALKAKDVLCVSCAKNMLILCHDKCLANYKLNVHSKSRRAVFTTPRIVKSKSLDTTHVASKTRFSIKTAQSKSLVTTLVVSKTKIVVDTHPGVKNKVVQIVLWIVDSGCSKHMTGLGHHLFSVGQLCDGDLEVAFHTKTCYVRNLEGDYLLTGDRESNLYTISISDMAASSPVCLMSKATSTKSLLWHRRLSHLSFGTINDLTKHDLVDSLPKFKYSKDHFCLIYHV